MSKIKSHLILLLIMFAASNCLFSQTDTNRMQVPDQNPNYLKSKQKYDLKPKDKTILTTSVTGTNSKTPINMDTTKFIKKSTVTQQEVDKIEAEKIKFSDKTSAITNLSKQYAQQGDYKKALEMQVLLKQVTDSLQWIELTSAAMQHELMTQNTQQRLLDSLKLDADAKMYQERVKVKQQKIDETQRLVLIIALGFVLLAIVSVLLFLSYKKTKLSHFIISEQKKETEQQKNIIEKSLEEKNMLLKEIHHRVKNNLQIVSSLLNLQLKGTDNAEAKRIMEEAKNRINTISLIHQSIYQSEDFTAVDLQQYFSQMTEVIDRLFNISQKKITYSIHTNHIKLTIDEAVPLGLIMNELLTNCYKYAFSNQQEGLINISVTQIDNQHYELQVSDNGQGFPEGFILNQQKTLGLKLVNGLAQQLKGSLRMESKQGAHFYLTFKTT